MQPALKKRKLMAFAVTGFILSTSAATEPPTHYNRHCIACHARMTGGEGETLYRRKNRIVNDYNALIARVEYCRAGAGADWTPTQTGEAVRYLNRRFYRFAQP